jgi:hypothetical protein
MILYAYIGLPVFHLLAVSDVRRYYDVGNDGTPNLLLFYLQVKFLDDMVRDEILLSPHITWIELPQKFTTVLSKDRNQ